MMVIFSKRWNGIVFFSPGHCWNQWPLNSKGFFLQKLLDFREQWSTLVWKIQCNKKWENSSRDKTWTCNKGDEMIIKLLLIILNGFWGNYRHWMFVKLTSMGFNDCMFLRVLVSMVPMVSWNGFNGWFRSTDINHAAFKTHND